MKYDSHPFLVPILFVVALPFMLIGCYGTSKVQVADGTRDSTVRKVSETGVIWKTWEIETLGDGFKFEDGKATPETFNYTVRNPDVVRQLQTVGIGRKVRIHYRKFLTAWAPTGESRYEVTGVELLEGK